MARIFVGVLKQETATFNPCLTDYDQFQVLSGQDVLRAFRGTRTELAGVIDQLESAGGHEIVPGVAATAVSGGPIRSDCLKRLMSDMLRALENARPLDGVCLCLHGAMAGQGPDEGDPEGRLLAEFRKRIGSAPLVASLDLHAVLTQDMVAAADVLVPFHTYPHVDQYSTGRRAAGVLRRLLTGQVQPVTVCLPLPMLVRGDELITATGKFGEAIRFCQQIEDSAGGLAAGVIIGNAFTDVPALQSNVLITRDDGEEQACREAVQVGRFMWQHRDLFQAQLKSLDESIAIADATEGVTVFSDAADATASGAAGDSNAILQGLLSAGFRKRGLLSVVDAPAVAWAHAQGAGASGQVHLGGTRDPGRFQPLLVEAGVLSLHDGNFEYEDGTQGRAGRAAVLRVASLDILVTERPVFVVGCAVFQAHGLDPRDYDLVVVKSPNGFRPYYESFAAAIVPVDVPGSTSANLKSLPFRHCVRPIFPLDEDVPDPFQ